MQLTCGESSNERRFLQGQANSESMDIEEQRTWQINAVMAFGIIIFPFVAAKSNGVIVSNNQVGEGFMILLFLHIYFVELSLFERCKYMYYYLWGKK